MERKRQFTRKAPAVKGYAYCRAHRKVLGSRNSPEAVLRASRADGGWLAEAFVPLATPATAAARRAGGARLPLFSGPGRKFALSFVPPVFVGALLTVVLFHAGLIAALPGMWLLLYGTAIVTGGAFSVRVVPVMGLCMMVLGGVALVSPERWGDLFMAAGFGVLQILFGAIIARRYGG